jgi:threonylcarbamoyladenosine tRNA methylthiotransferase MtaB
MGSTWVSPPAVNPRAVDLPTVGNSQQLSIDEDRSQYIGLESFSISTLGCKVNSFESELMAEKLAEHSMHRVKNDVAADLCIINTCTVTAEADRQARQVVRRIIRRNPDAKVVVTGCYAQMEPETCLAIPGVSLVLGNDRKLDMDFVLASLALPEAAPTMAVGDLDRDISLPDRLIQGFEGRSRAFIQAQQGCDQGCTFCIIHKARGPNHSFAAKQIIDQAQALIANGYGEIVLCGVDLGAYGQDMAPESASGGYYLHHLLTNLCAIEGDFMIRLSSLDPAHIDDDLINIITENPRICKQLHLSLQSASGLILKRMKRRATPALIFERIAALRAGCPDLVLSADILVGFPTEEEEHFQETLTAIDDLVIAFPHVFTYSPRAGTPAAKIPRQVPVAVRKQRAKLIQQAGKAVWRKQAATRIGKRMRVLVESVKNNAPDSNSSDENTSRFAVARASDYFTVQFDSATAVPGQWAEVEIHDLVADRLLGYEIIGHEV